MAVFPGVGMRIAMCWLFAMLICLCYTISLDIRGLLARLCRRRA
jgi:hypothetical protein